MDKDVIILMSTYNGEKYIREQLESILNQTYSNIKILIRDDGSTDGTLDILKEYSNKYSNISFYVGENLKPAKSFINLIQTVEDAAYYAFSDQDDVWDKDKIEVAVKRIEEFDNEKPCLYFSDTRLVDKELNPLNNTRKLKEDKLCYGNALIENFATGCTVVFNKETIKLLKQIKLEDVGQGFMHDSLAYRITYSTGNIAYDRISHISYRQHENNVIGHSSNFIDKIKKRKKNVKKTINTRSNMAKYILEKYNDQIVNDKRVHLETLAYYRKSVKNKFKLLFDFKIKRMTFIDDVLYRCAILINKI